jgi:hypothetical protein
MLRTTSNNVWSIEHGSTVAMLSTLAKRKKVIKILNCFRIMYVVLIADSKVSRRQPRTSVPIISIPQQSKDRRNPATGPVSSNRIAEDALEQRLDDFHSWKRLQY